MLRYCICTSHCILFNAFVYQHKCLPLDLRGNTTHYVEGFEINKTNMERGLLKNLTLLNATKSLVALTDLLSLSRLAFIH